jgi:hypothetical protein
MTRAEAIGDFSMARPLSGPTLGLAGAAGDASGLGPPSPAAIRRRKRAPVQKEPRR